MKEQFEYYAVIPPDESDLDNFKLRNGIGSTENLAWSRFCCPALSRKAYEDDGFKAKKVMITIEEI